MAREMKDSGIQWVGIIPADWECRRLRFLCEIQTGNQDTQDSVPNGLFPFYVRSPIVERSNKYTFEGPAILMAGDGAGAGRVFHYVDGKYGCHQRVYSLQKITDINRRFLYYYLSNLFYREIEIANSKSTVDSVRLPMLQNFQVVFPNDHKQKKIVEYLDSKCAEIDVALDKTRTSIEEYKNLKQAIITQAVTKGIRGDRPMKESGIEWIGNIPSDYSVYRLKHLVNGHLEYGANISGVEFSSKLPRYIRITDITLDGKLKEFGKLSLEEDTAAPYILRDGDILFARSGATVGKSFIYKETYGRAAFAGYLIKATIREGFSADYIYLYTNSSLYDSWKSGIFIQSTIQNIGADRYADLPIVIPNSFDEQLEIVDYLNNISMEIDKIISRKEEIFAELESYKKSLIYEYVTGKKEAPQT